MSDDWTPPVKRMRLHRPNRLDVNNNKEEIPIVPPSIPKQESRRRKLPVRQKAQRNISDLDTHILLEMVDNLSVNGTNSLFKLTPNPPN